MYQKVTFVTQWVKLDGSYPLNVLFLFLYKDRVAYWVGNYCRAFLLESEQSCVQNVYDLVLVLTDGK